MILVVDDDRTITASLALLLKHAGHATVTAASAAEALRIVEGGVVDLVIQDMNFSRQTTGEEGLALLRDLKRSRPELPVILITAWGTIPLAIEGIRSGAVDFITKPWTHQQILQSVKTALSLAAAGRPAGLPRSRAELDERHEFQGIIGEDAKILRILEVLARVAATDAPVLITGESGTGKELVAEAIHRNSHRRGGAFVKVNLGGISSTLFESEIFGHVRGAFTDARTDRKGRFEMAAGGTIFLDEIGDLEPTSQVKLLRVLQDRTFEVLGSSITRTVDVRVVSATNRNLGELVAQGLFREDLLYRLNLIAIHLPPLRERKGDIPLLVRHFLTCTARTYRREGVMVAEPALRWLQQLPWPGNVRQLAQVVERAVLFSDRLELQVEDFQILEKTAAPAETVSCLPPVGAMSLDELERAMILKALEHHQGHITRAAADLGLSRTAFYRRLEKYGIKP